MAHTYIRTVTVTPVSDQYSWSAVDGDGNDILGGWIQIVEDSNIEDQWNITVQDNQGSSQRTATLTVTHSNGTTSDSISVTQAGVANVGGGSPPPVQTTAAPQGTYDSIAGTINPANEGMSLTFTIQTSGIPQGVVPTYQLTPITTDSSGNAVSAIEAADVVGGSLSGNMSAIDSNGEATVSITFAMDQTDEGGPGVYEWYDFKVTGDNSGQTYGNLPLVLAERKVNDVSTGSPRWVSARLQTVSGLSRTNSQGVNEGTNYHVFLAGESQPLGTQVWYKIEPEYTGVLGQQQGADQLDFDTPIQGSFSLGSGPGTWTVSGANDPNPDVSQYGSFLLEVKSDEITEGKEGFTVEFYEDSGFTNKVTAQNGLGIEVNLMSLNDTSTSPLLPTSSTTTTTTIAEDPAGPVNPNFSAG